VQGKLKKVRAAIREAVPQAVETISYGIPWYSYKGRLAYFALAKAHIGLYMPTTLIEEHKKELAGYHVSRATVRLPLEEEVPILLIKKLVKAQVKKNEARMREGASGL